MTETPQDVKTEEVGGMERLKAQFQDLNLDLLNVVISADFEATEKGVEEIFDATEKVQETVTNVLKWQDEMAKFLTTIENPMKRRIAIDEIAKKQDDAQGKLEFCLGHEVPYFRLAAALAYLKYGFGQVFKNTGEARKMLADLEKRKLLVPANRNEHGAIQIGYDFFELGQEFGFEPEDSKEIARWIGEYSRRLTILIKQERQEDMKEMKREASISPDQLWNGELGNCLLNIPPESYLDRANKERWLGGGPLLVSATSKEIIPLSGKGGALERQVELMHELDVRLPRHTLQWECPPGGYGGADNKAFDRTVDGVMRTRDLSRDETVGYVNKMRMLWHILLRFYNASDAMAEQSELKKEFLGIATITPEAFFRLNGNDQPQDGDVLLEFEGSFQVDGSRSVFCPFALVRRAKKEGRSIIEVLRIAPHTHDMLGGVISKEYSEGNNFRETPGYLRRFLRAVQGQVEMAHAVDQS